MSKTHSRPKPKAILFDLDNTLYPALPCHEAGLMAAAQVAHQAGAVLDKQSFESVYNEARQEIRDRLPKVSASHNRVLHFQRLVENWAETVDPELVLSLYEAYWESYLRAMVLDADAHAVLKSARESGIWLAIVSDMTAYIQHKKLAQLGLQRIFDTMVTSEEAGVEKPDPTMLQLALSRLGVEAKDSWIVGDSLERDVAAGKALGVYTVLYRRGGGVNGIHQEPYPDEIVSDFKGLRRILFQS